MYVVTVTFEVAEGNETRFLQAVREQAANSLALETGCSAFDVCVNGDSAERVFLYEIYSDKAAFNTHLNSVHFTSFNELTMDWVKRKRVETWSLQEPVS